MDNLGDASLSEESHQTKRQNTARSYPPPTPALFIIIITPLEKCDYLILIVNCSNVKLNGYGQIDKTDKIRKLSVRQNLGIVWSSDTASGETNHL